MKELEVATSVGEPLVMSSAETEAIAQATGLVSISKGEYSAILKAGDAVKRIGPIRWQRGTALVAQQRLNAAANALLREILDIHADKEKKNRAKDMATLSQALALLTGRLTDSQHYSAHIDGQSHGPAPVIEADLPRVPTLAPGQQLVIAGKEVHVHQSPGKSG